MFPSLDQEVEAIITLDCDTPEVCHRMTVVATSPRFE
jgi:hypothetical protein